MTTIQTLIRRTSPFRQGLLLAACALCLNCGTGWAADATSASPASAAKPAAAASQPPKASSAQARVAKAGKRAKASKGAKHAKPRKTAIKPDAGTPYGSRADVMAFAHAQAESLGYDEEALRKLLMQARQLPAVQRLVMPAPAGTAKNWQAYRERFVEPQRLQAGLAFWQAHAAALERAQAQYGVPAEIIVGIIGVETFYGRITGEFRTLDALATLSFDFPTGRKDRSEFFQDELRQFLILCKREHFDPLGVKGSYTGALGFAQFMPGSWNRFGVDFDGDGRIDLMGSADDAIGSVANFLVQHGWKAGQTTDYSVAAPVDSIARATLLGQDVVPSFTAAQMAKLGAVLSPAGQMYESLLALVELQNGGAAPSYVAGTENFYALTRYNWSAYYAMGVIELGRQVAALRRAQ